MPHTHRLFRSAAREKVLHGAAAIADAVRVTLGPKSTCVLIEKTRGKPLVCSDGVTIATTAGRGDWSKEFFGAGKPVISITHVGSGAPP